MLIIDDELNITITRGDTATLTLTVKDGDTDYDYSSDLTQFTVKRSTETQDIVFQKTFSGTSIEITPDDTKNLYYTDLYYDVQLITPENKVYTVITPHKFIIGEEVNFSVTRT